MPGNRNHEPCGGGPAPAGDKKRSPALRPGTSGRKCEIGRFGAAGDGVGGCHLRRQATKNDRLPYVPALQAEAVRSGDSARRAMASADAT